MTVLFFVVTGIISIVIATNDQIQDDGTAKLNLTTSVELPKTVIVGKDFSMKINLTNQADSDGDAYNPGFYVKVPKGITYKNSSGLGAPIKTGHVGGETILFFETPDIVVKGSTQTYNMSFTSAPDMTPFAKNSIGVGAYAEDSIYGRGDVPTGSPDGTLPGGVDAANQDISFPINFPKSFPSPTFGVNDLPFQSADVQFVPYDIIKAEEQEMLIGGEQVTTLKVLANEIGPLKNLVIKDVIPNNRKFLGIAYASGVGTIDIAYNTPTSGQVTLMFSDIVDIMGKDLVIQYKTIPLGYPIKKYDTNDGNKPILADTPIEHSEKSPNTFSLEGGKRTDENNVETDIAPVRKVTKPTLVYTNLSKSVNKKEVAVDEVITYSLKLTVAENVKFVSGSTITDILPDGLSFTGDIRITLGTGGATTDKVELTSSQPNSAGGTTSVFTLTDDNILTPGSELLITYRVLVDNNYDGPGEQLVNGDELTNTATFVGIIGPSGQDADSGLQTDGKLIGNRVTYDDKASIIAPDPKSSKHLVSVVMDGIRYDHTNPLDTKPLGTKPLAPGAEVEFAVTMQFPNVHTTGAMLKDFLPLIMGPHTDIYDIQFVPKDYKDMNGNPIPYNKDSGEKDGQGVDADVRFNGLTLQPNVTVQNTPWITTEPANTVVFNLGEFTGARTFSIRFKTKVRPIKPSGYNNQGQLPQKNISLGYYRDGDGNTKVLGLNPVEFSLASPALTLTKSAPANSKLSYGGDPITYTIVLENKDGKSAAFVDPLVDTFPAGMRYASGSLSSPDVGASATQSGDNQLVISWDNNERLEIAPEGRITLTYQLEATKDFVIDTTPKKNIIKADYFATATATGGVNNFGPLKAEATIGARQPSITRSIIATSETGSVGNDLLIGEEVTFETIITLSGGVYLTGSFTEQLHSNLEFLTGTVVAYSGSLSFSRGTNFSGNVVNFGTITNSATTGSQTIVIHTTARSTTGSTEGSKSAQGIFLYDNGKGIEKDTPPRVVKPLLTLVKKASPNEAVAGTPITYTIKLTNNSTVAPAYDITLKDILPSGLNVVDRTLEGNAAWSGSQSDLFSDGLFLAELGTGGSQEIKYQAVTSDDVKAGSTLTNTGSIVYSTLDDDNSPFERNDTKSAKANVKIKDFGVTHQVVETSYTGTVGTGIATIGEIVTYDIYIAVPQVNATGVILTQSLPAGVEFLTGWVRSSLVASDELSPDIDISLVGTGIRFNFGAVSNTGTDAGTGLILRTQLRITDSPENTRGKIAESTATLYYDENSKNTKTHKVSLQIVEPSLTITKKYAVHTGTAGDVIRTTITVENKGNAPAHNISIDDLQPPKTLAGAGYSLLTGLSLLAPEKKQEWTYDTTLLSGVSFGETLYGTGIIQRYTSLPATTDKDVRTYTGGSSRDYIQILGGTGVIKSLTNPNSTQKTIADTVGYTITFPVINGVTPSLVVTDTLPDGLAYTGDATITWSNSISGIIQKNRTISDHKLTRDFGKVENSDTTDQTENVTITFDTIVTNTDANNNGDIKANNVSVDYANGSQILTGVSPQIQIIEPSLGLMISAAYDYGTEIVYTFTLTNTGSSTAYDIQIPTILSGGLTYVASTLSGDGVSLDDNTFTLSSLAPGATKTFKINATVSSSVANMTELGLAATATYTSQSGTHTGERTGAVGDSVNDYITSATIKTKIKLPLLDETLTVDKTIDDIGESFTYTLTLTNTGSVNLTGIDISIPLSEHLTGWSSDGLKLSGDAFVLTGEELDIGQSRVYVFTGTAKTTTPDQTKVTTTATVSDTPQGAKGGTPSVIITIRAPILTSQISQTDINGGQLRAGESISNTATIGNTGSTTGINIDVIIYLRPDEEFVLDSVSVGSGSLIDPAKIYYNSNKLYYRIPTLAPGASVVVHFDTKVRDGTPSGTVIQPSLKAESEKGVKTSAIANQLIVRNSVTGGSGGRPSTPRDDCPNGDQSPSRYDGTCEQTIIEKDDDGKGKNTGKGCYYADEKYVDRGYFTDTVQPTVWGIEFIEYMRLNCIHRGRATVEGKRLYYPDADITKAEVLKTMAKIRGIAKNDLTISSEEDRYPGQQVFEDVPYTHWAVRYTEYALKHGIAQGQYSIGPAGLYLSPESAISRYDAIEMMVHTYESIYGEIHVPDSYQTNMIDFSDQDPRYDIVAKAEYKGIIEGRNYNGIRKLEGNSPITRQEFAKVAYLPFQEQLFIQP